MTPAAIIRDAQADGVCLTLGKTGTIKVTGESCAVNRWVAAIREHKAGIIDALTDGEAEHAQRPAWRLHSPDGESLDVFFCPAVTQADALSDYPHATKAEPIPERPRRAATESEAEELRGLIEAVYLDGTDLDRAEALDAALSDPAGALRCYRAILKARNT